MVIYWEIVERCGKQYELTEFSITATGKWWRLEALREIRSRRYFLFYTMVVSFVLF